MFALTYAALLFGLMAFPLYAFHQYSRRARTRQQRALRLQLQEFAGQHGLKLSCEELLPDAIIGLDGQQRQLLVLHPEAEGPAVAEVLPLEALRCCSIESEPLSEDAGAEDAGDRVVLRLDVAGRSPKEILFYEGRRGPEADQCAHRARRWQVLLTKMQPG